MADLRVGFLGDGHLNGVLRRTVEMTRPYRVIGSFGRQDELPDATEMDVIVEAATPDAVRERVPGVLAAGIDAILLSVGALADPEVRAGLLASVPTHGGRGRLIACTGAIGGIDQVRALRTAGPLRALSIESRKLPQVLVQPWMTKDLRAALRAGDAEIVVADGLASDVARLFPSSANVAASLALAGDAWEFATARVIADPAAVATTHEIHAAGAIGEVRTIVTNAPSPERPRSSAVVSWAALRALDDYARLRGAPAPPGPLFL
ncbi:MULTISPECIES: aspartate dehydrogenase domain-containing protein [Bacteria]|uniref:aspartate dehydrogenase domain-containing protein n=1 Tax=Bacteria TaxID=2 RepID=UPI003C7E76CC